MTSMLWIIGLRNRFSINSLRLVDLHSGDDKSLNLRNAFELYEIEIVVVADVAPLRVKLHMLPDNEGDQIEP